MSAAASREIWTAEVGQQAPRQIIITATVDIGGAAQW